MDGWLNVTSKEVRSTWTETTPTNSSIVATSLAITKELHKVNTAGGFNIGYVASKASRKCQGR
jgi:hypothetical protein